MLEVMSLSARTRKEKRRVSVPLATLAVLLWASSAVASSVNLEGYCAPSDRDPSKLNDYRKRDSTPFLTWSIKDNWANHTGPATERIQSGEYSHRVMADLAFTLGGWPNHVRALQALVQYDIGGGKHFEFPSTFCYFTRALEFAPNDVDVLLLEAFWRWKLGDLKQAVATYKSVLSMDPSSAEGHYHLGLLYIELRDYPKSFAQAKEAYRLGYPLPGLRDKLAALGYWHD